MQFEVDDLPGKTIKLIFYHDDHKKFNIKCTDGSTFYISSTQEIEIEYVSNEFRLKELEDEA